MEVLRTENLTKIYGSGENEVRAVNDVSFSLEKGEFTAIIGASGSGKSTLMHILGGVDVPTSGKVIINGEDTSRLNADQLAVFRRREIGIIYQFYNLLPVLTAEENILLPTDLDGKEPDRERLKDIIAKLGLEGREKHLPSQLSGGQQQRVAIGRALMPEPALLLCDEPTGNLDKKASDEIIALLRKLNRDFQQTILIITHDLGIADQADRVITLQDGRIISDEKRG